MTSLVRGKFNRKEGLAVFAEVEFCRPIPDGDTIFKYVPNGACIEVDGVLYVRQSEWVSFIVQIKKAIVSE